MIRELAYHSTPLGPLVLRVRPEPVIGGLEVFEVKLGEDFLMSSLFTAGEEALADLGIEGLGKDLDVVVGGLGLGHTAKRVLDHGNVRSMLVIEAFEEVIAWHRERLVPCGGALSGNPRCRFVKGDFFRLAATGFDPTNPGRKFDAVLLDIDHSPDNCLDARNSAFYTPEGLNGLRRSLLPGGVFAMWSNDEPDETFVELLRTVFEQAAAHIIEFANPYTGKPAFNSIYVCRT